MGGRREMYVNAHCNHVSEKSDSQLLILLSLLNPRSREKMLANGKVVTARTARVCPTLGGAPSCTTLSVPVVLTRSRVQCGEESYGCSCVPGSVASVTMDGWAAMSCRALRSRLLPGSWRGQGEAPEGCGNGMRSNSWPA